MNTTEQFEVILKLAGARFAQLDESAAWGKGERARVLSALRAFGARTRYMRGRLDALRADRSFRSMVAAHSISNDSTQPIT